MGPLGRFRFMSRPGCPRDRCSMLPRIDTATVRHVRAATLVKWVMQLFPRRLEKRGRVMEDLRKEEVDIGGLDSSCQRSVPFLRLDINPLPDGWTLVRIPALDSDSSVDMHVSATGDSPLSGTTPPWRSPNPPKDELTSIRLCQRVLSPNCAPSGKLPTCDNIHSHPPRPRLLTIIFIFQGSPGFSDYLQPRSTYASRPASR